MSRMYRNKLPNYNDVVMVKIDKVNNAGIYVKLLEYEDIQGFILMSDISRKKIPLRSIKPGIIYSAVVLRIDEEKKYIDLSKKNVNLQQSEATKEKFNKSKIVHRIINELHRETNQSIESLYEMFVWDLYEKYEHAHEAFKQIITGSLHILDSFKIQPHILNHFYAILQNRMSPKSIKIHAEIEVMNFGVKGMDDIKESFLEAKKLQYEGIEFQFLCLVAPLYIIKSSVFDLHNGLKQLNNACNSVQKNIEERGGVFQFKALPQITNSSHEKNYLNIIEKAAKSMQEINGDDEEND